MISESRFQVLLIALVQSAPLDVDTFAGGRASDAGWGTQQGLRKRSPSVFICQSPQGRSPRSRCRSTAPRSDRAPDPLPKANAGQNCHSDRSQQGRRLFPVRRDVRRDRIRRSPARTSPACEYPAPRNSSAINCTGRIPSPLMGDRLRKVCRKRRPVADIARRNRWRSGRGPRFQAPRNAESAASTRSRT